MDGQSEKNNVNTNQKQSIFDQAWNTLKSMRFAIIILLVITVATIFNLFANEFIVPVRGGAEEAGIVYHQAYGNLKASLLLFFQMYSPYSSWWYTFLLGLLTLSLLVCIIERTPRTFRKSLFPTYVKSEDRLKYLNNCKQVLGDNAIEDRFKNTLRKKGYSYNVCPDSTDDEKFVCADKNRIVNLGSWLVHIGFVVLVFGAILISRGEYRSQAAGYPGEYLSESEAEWGFNVRVDDFIIEYYPLETGQIVSVDGVYIGKLMQKNEDDSYEVEMYTGPEPFMNNVSPERISNRIEQRTQNGRIDQANISDYIAILTVIENGEEIFTRRVEVNYPLRHNGYRFYQSSFNDLRTNDQGKWTTIMGIRRDKGAPFVWVGMAFVSFGLIIAMYLTPRQIHAVIRKDKSGTAIVFAGRTTRNKEFYKEEINNIAEKLKS